MRGLRVTRITLAEEGRKGPDVSDVGLLALPWARGTDSRNRLLQRTTVRRRSQPVTSGADAVDIAPTIPLSRAYPPVRRADL
jgi:hypothetical protein